MLASGANDMQLLTWNMDGMVQGQQQQLASVRAVAWSPDSQWLTAGSANQVALFNATNGLTQQQIMAAHNKTVTTLAWSPQQPLRLLSGSNDMQAIVWNMPAFTQQTIFAHHTAAILSGSWASDNQTVATSSQGGVIRVWNANSGQEVHGYYLDAQLPMRVLAFDPTGSMLAVGGDDGLVRLWFGLTCQQEQQGGFGNQCMDAPQRLTAHTGIVRTLAWSPDGRLLATGGDDGTLAIWYPTHSQTPLLRVRQDAPVLSLAWSPSGKQVATASGNSVTLWGLY
jgi:WD40 repeat protein